MTISSVTQLLGGKKTLGREVRTRMDLIDLSRKGVSKEALLVLAKFMGLPVSQMAALLPVTERTIQRYAPKEHFDQGALRPGRFREHPPPGRSRRSGAGGVRGP